MIDALLINTNPMRPPVAPLALDYLAGALAASGMGVRILDLTFSENAGDDIARALRDIAPAAVGMSLRNTDDCFWPGGEFFAPRLARTVAAVRARTQAAIVLGGCGFSIFPAQLMNDCAVDLGVVGDGERPFVEIVSRLRAGQDLAGIPGLAAREASGRVSICPPSFPAVLSVPTARVWVDNARYLREGGMGSIETKRGCPGRCIYCADPLGKGAASRCRAPEEVAGECEALLAQGIDVLHLCDSEFNIPLHHARAVCEALVRRGLGRAIRWYCYAAIRPFPSDLAHAMRAAGCVGINFGADSACDRMLAALGRDYRREDVAETVAACRAAGITVMLDLLLGGPGESQASVRETIESVKSMAPDCAGAAIGLRVYPGTELARIVASQVPMADNPNLHGAVTNNEDFYRPVFYIERALGDDPAALVAEAVGRDERFFLPAGGATARDHNYNANERLTRAIAAGARGAFWDILRRGV